MLDYCTMRTYICKQKKSGNFLPLSSPFELQLEQFQY